jgi:hypothetical protein
MRQGGFLWRSILSVSLCLVFFVFLSAAEAFLLPDTGQTTCYSDKGKGHLIACPAPEQPLAQDGSYSIHVPSYTINGDGTVTDNNTFLIWPEGSWNFYGAWDQANEYCKNLTLAGRSDWRLPSKIELASIVDYGKSNPASNASVFPGIASAYYWSSSQIPDNAWAWVVNFGDGSLGAQLRNNAGYAKCVRGNMNVDDLVNNSDGTLTDTAGGLMWQTAGGGQMKWGYALKYCENLSLAGYTDWRLPNVRELEFLAESNSISAYTSTGYYWASTTNVGDAAYGWVVLLRAGSTAVNLKRGGDNVLCVRGKKGEPLDDQEISVSPSKLNFGYAESNEHKSLTLTITNIGRHALVVGNVVPPLLPFSITADGCSGKTLTGWDSCTMTVDFTSTSPGIITGSITIPSNDADHQNVKVNLWATGSPVPGGKYLLPDTGQTYCFSGNDGYKIGCPNPGSPLAQDGSYTINSMSFTNNGDGTVTDNNTFLMWQRDDDNVLRNRDDAENYCENLTLGGSAGWRLPAGKEIVSITDYNFPASTFGGVLSVPLSPLGFPNAGTKGYMVSDNESRNSLFYVKCVRGGLLPYGPFTDNGDSTITDSSTGLMWQNNMPTIWPDWATALGYCEGLSLGGYTDWRLPNVKELISLAPLYDPWVSVRTNAYWSSTTQLSTPLSYYDEAYRVDVVAGGIDGLTCCRSFTDLAGVRCVRGGHTAQTFMPTLTITSPQDGAVINASSVTVTGIVNNAATVTVNGIPASVAGNAFGVIIPLSEGHNAITADAADSYGRKASSSVYVYSVTEGAITGMTTDSSTGLPLASASVSLTDSADVTQTALTDSGGNFTIAPVSAGAFSGSIVKDGYARYLFTGTAFAGQTTDVIAALDPVLPTIYNVTVSGITADSAVITWTTNLPSDSRVEYGITTAHGSAANDSASTTTHSIALTNLTPETMYHFIVKSTNSYGFSSSSVDNTFTTFRFSAKTLGDFGNIAVMGVKGSYDSNNADGTMNYLPRQEIAKEFIKSHSDDYDFMIIFSNFDFTMPRADARAFYLEVKNDVLGIGKAVFDDSTSYGSNGKLQGMIDMGNILNKVSDPSAPGFEDTLTTLAHEQMHRWGASVKFKDSDGNTSTALLGKDGAHWSYLLDSDASVMYGNDWQDNKDGTFTSTGREGYYSALDLYLAGFYDKSQVPPMLLIDNPAIDPVKLPEVATTISGTARYVTIDDIIAAEGERVPDASTSQKNFKTAFILITAPNTFTGNELPGIENIRNGWTGRFAQLAGGKGSIADVAPDITIAVSSPSNGDTITGPSVTVRGAVINTTGNETGVTVNGTVANVYGNRFVANHVPLMEGANTLTITAIDSAGTTASTSISVDTVAGDYIRLSSNIDSGITPLGVTLRIDGSFSIGDADLSIEGPTVAEIVDNPAPDEYTLKFNFEGVYNVTVTVTGPDGKIYEDAIRVTVLNREQLDKLLKAKWEEMKGAMSEKNVEKAMAFFLGSSQERYRYIYTNILDLLPTVAAEMLPIEMIDEEGGVAEYRIRRMEPEGEVTYYIYFVLDENGTWKIQQF